MQYSPNNKGGSTVAGSCSVVGRTKALLLERKALALTVNKAATESFILIVCMYYT